MELLVVGLRRRSFRVRVRVPVSHVERHCVDLVSGLRHPAKIFLGFQAGRRRRSSRVRVLVPVSDIWGCLGKKGHAAG